MAHFAYLTDQPTYQRYSNINVLPNCNHPHKHSFGDCGEPYNPHGTGLREPSIQGIAHTRRVRPGDFKHKRTNTHRSLKNVISRFGRLSYRAGGMHVRVIGRQVSRDEAAVLVLAPHSSFLDSVIVYVTNMCSVMVRKESMDNFAGSKLLCVCICVWSAERRCGLLMGATIMYCILL